jgi:tetratricopeptide (TPR) repeat protein
MFRFRRLLRVLLPAFFVFAPILVQAQQSSASTAAQPQSQPSTANPATDEPHGRLILVLPFENRTGQPNLDWIGSGAADIFNRRLDAAGFLTIGRDDRLYALDRLGLPLNFRPSRATTIRIAQLLDADFVIIGNYTLTGQQLGASARILNLHQLTLRQPITEQAGLNNILDTFNRLAWDTARKLDPTYSVAEQTFLAADGPLRPGAFENYIRGMIAEEPADRISHLREAVRISPGFTPARLELGRAYFANQDYDDAAATFGQMPRDDPDALEADFYRGLALFFTGKYLGAEDAFAFVATQLPLPEVINNEGVAASRRGRDGTALFRQAITADPRDADYHFNLAIALRKHNNIPGAIRELQTDLKFHPQDSEAQSFLALLQKPAPKTVPAAATAQTGTAAEESLPLERIKRSYNETEFRQAAFEMEQIQEARLTILPPAERAQKLVASGDQFLHRGLILEAEREYQAALQANPTSALAHAGLAQVRERSFDLKAARAEAQQSLRLAPNVPAYLVLARLDLESSQLAAAANEVSEALHLDPRDTGALGMKQALIAKGQQIP